jgi:CheY-like chemotaxis protein
MKRILIVDDDPGIQLLYSEELSEEGYDVISSDGEKGLLQLIAAKRPDLILLDVKLKSRSGLSVLQDIRNAFQGIPVIVTTAYPTFQFDPKSLGANAYVTKSSDLTGLKQQVEKCLATSGPPYEKGFIPAKNAPITVMDPAVRLGMRSISHWKRLGPKRNVRVNS